MWPTAPTLPRTRRPQSERTTIKSCSNTRLRDALRHLNPALPREALADAFRKLIRPDGSTLETPQPRFPPHAGGRRDSRIPNHRGHPAGSPSLHPRLRGPSKQRLAGGQPVHRRRRGAPTTAGHRAVRQRPSAWSDRAQEPGGREGHGVDGLAADPDLQSRALGPVFLQRRAHRFGRSRRAHRHAHRRARVVQTVADDRRRDAGRPRICPSFG